MNLEADGPNSVMKCLLLANVTDNATDRFCVQEYKGCLYFILFVLELGNGVWLERSKMI